MENPEDGGLDRQGEDDQSPEPGADYSVEYCLADDSRESGPGQLVPCDSLDEFENVTEEKSWIVDSANGGHPEAFESKVESLIERGVFTQEEANYLLAVAYTNKIQSLIVLAGAIEEQSKTIKEVLGSSYEDGSEAAAKEIFSLAEKLSAKRDEFAVRLSPAVVDQDKLSITELKPDDF